jgi:hypothetical protein
VVRRLSRLRILGEFQEPQFIDILISFRIK